MQYTLQNEHLKATFKDMGAELCKLTNSEGVDFIWNGDPKYWGRHAPILFPFVGKVVNNNYTFTGNSFEIGQHGFARDMLFTVTSQEENELTFTLTSSSDTHIFYPFDFTLHINYTLVGNTLDITYTVINEDTQAIAFKIGAHPAFMCPLLDGEKRSDYLIKFEQKEDNATIMALKEDGLFSHETSHFSGQSLSLADDLFQTNAAFVLRNLKSDAVSLYSPNNKHCITFTFKEFPVFALWSPGADAPFICLEPWFGHADFEDESSELFDKTNIITLNEGHSFVCTHSIKIQ